MPAIVVVPVMATPFPAPFRIDVAGPPVAGTDVREIHIDAQHIPAGLLEALIALGFVDDHFVAAGNGMERPPYHLTWQYEGERQDVRRRFDDAWRASIGLIEACPEFVGYVEAEYIPAGYQVGLPLRPYAATAPFPLPALVLESSAANKVADLHVKVPLRYLTTELEGAMAGVFYVETPSANRIYTIQFLGHEDGRMAFAAMVDYFTAAGGASDITYEICPAFHRQPHHLIVPAAVQRGALAAALASPPER